MTAFERDLKAIGKTADDYYALLADINGLDENKDGFTIARIPRKGWVLSGFIGMEFRTCRIGLDVLKRVFDDPGKAIERFREKQPI